ncbi:polymorphic toxin-type HINT domain-containing protein [Paenibacillus durus]|uniref:Hint domain-containing protein n=1 Tax=Paenibacillus durus TaxID=44251 RepID=A0A089HX70_PAEDU|nr:hypothetical protein PDUR_25915 [Paenibacillus durus]
MLGRRVSKTRFNHTGETQEVTNYVYKGDTWVITEERDGAGGVTKSYSYDTNERPLTITYKGQTYWYVYNGHGDVVALTDAEGKVAARYEYDAWGLVTGMYNRYGERVREGIGWMGDLGSGNGSPGSLQGPEDESGNTEPDYHPGNGNANGKANGKANSEPSEEQTVTGDSAAAEETVTATSAGITDLVTEEAEPTEDITTELVKENPYRYAAYYWDRKTQYYYLQARYYDPRQARFISEDTVEGEIEAPPTLNLYTYVMNNPLMYTDPTGHIAWYQYDDLGRGVYDSMKGMVTGLLSPSTYKGLYQLGKAIYKKEISFTELGKSVVDSAVGPYRYLALNTGKVFGGKPSNRQVRTYGENLGEVLISFAGSAKAMGLIGKVAPALAKKLKHIKIKRPSAGEKIGSKGTGKALKSCNCFVGGTKVQTDEGEKPIEKIEVGDKVLSKDEVTGEVAYKEVTATFNHESDEIYKIHVGDQVIESTYNHPFWVEGKGWTFVKDLKPRDLLVQSDGHTLKIDSIEVERKHVTVYNMTVDEFHTYFVSDLGIWVHNTGGKCPTDILKTQKERGPTQKLTNSEVKDLAKYLGFKEVKGGKKGLVFTDGKVFITQDLDSHIGGIWKMSKTIEKLNKKETRMGTYDAHLKRIGD